MKRIVVIANVLIIAFILWFWPFRAGGTSSNVPATSTELNAVERKMAIDLANKALVKRKLDQGKVVLSRIELFRDPYDAESSRKAIVTHYRYAENDAVLTAVDIARQSVVSVEIVKNFPIPLSKEEANNAIRLAKDHPSVKSYLNEYPKMKMEALLTHSGEKSQPAFKNRVADILFIQDGDYLNAPLVRVDLTLQKVYFTPLRKKN